MLFIETSAKAGYNVKQVRRESVVTQVDKLLCDGRFRRVGATTKNLLLSVLVLFELE